jgi:hypothetical protein
LHEGGVFLITSLTLEGEVVNKSDEVIFNMIRPDSPSLKDIQNVAKEYPCEMAFEDVTHITIKAFSDWVVENDHLIDNLLLWPLTIPYRRYFQASKRLADTGVLKQFDVAICKKA